MLKGKTKIQLYNAKTGKLEKEFIKENMVTNAYSNLLSPDWIIDLYTKKEFKIDPAKNYTPIINLLGGILLFSKTLEEDLNNILPNRDLYDNFVGNAGAPWSGQSKLRGTLNASETEPITNGFKYVWDFPTNAANGLINALALTSVEGGNAGLYQDDADLTDVTHLAGYAEPLEVLPVFKNCINNCCTLIASLESSKDGVYVCNLDKNKILTVKKLNDTQYLLKEITISGNIKLDTDIKEITTPSSLLASSEITTVEHVITTTNKLQDELYIQHNNNEIFSVVTEYDGINKALTIKTVIINLLDFSLIEKTQTLLIDVDFLVNAKSTYANNKVYITNNTETTAIIYDTIEETYETIILPGVGLIAIKWFNTVAFMKYKTYWWEANNPNFYILGIDNKLYKNKLNASKGYIGLPIFRMDYATYKAPIITCSTTDDVSYNYINFNILTPYLASINNLQAFIKYNTQTLKITYEITNY